MSSSRGMYVLIKVFPLSKPTTVSTMTMRFLSLRHVVVVGCTIPNHNIYVYMACVKTKICHIQKSEYQAVRNGMPGCLGNLLNFFIVSERKKFSAYYIAYHLSINY
jgi:hypothetical protein